MHARRFREFTYALAAEWREGCGKTAAGKQDFRRELNQVQVVTDDLHELKRHAAALRRTRGKLAAS
jgi:hypothetical protein